MYDLEFLNNLSYNESIDVIHAVREAQEATSFARISYLADLAFCIISPKYPLNVLHSSEKNFANLNYSVSDVRRGLHIVRMMFAREAARVRSNLRSESLLTEGYHVQENLLEDGVLERLRVEISKFPLATSKDESNLIRNNQTGAIKEAFHDIFESVAFYLGGRHPQIFGNAFIQKLHNRAGDGDVQKYLHSDTYFPAYKYWYFPNEVREEDGPFAYVPQSHRLTKNLLEWYYKQSIDIVEGRVTDRTYGHAEGSFRIFPEELETLGLKEITFPVKANTLLIANVFGFHRRSEVTQEGYRDSIHGSIRWSPLE